MLGQLSKSDKNTKTNQGEKEFLVRVKCCVISGQQLTSSFPGLHVRSDNNHATEASSLINNPRYESILGE